MTHCFENDQLSFVININTYSSINCFSIIIFRPSRIHRIHFASFHLLFFGFISSHLITFAIFIGRSLLKEINKNIIANKLKLSYSMKSFIHRHNEYFIEWHKHRLSTI